MVQDATVTDQEVEDLYQSLVAACLLYTSTLCGLMVLLYALAIPRALLLVDWIAPAVLVLAALFAAGALGSRRRGV